MIRPIEVEARDGFRIWLRYSDGASGEVDLSHLAGRGVFAAWNEPGYFDKVHIAPHRAITWGDEIGALPGMQCTCDLTGKSVEEVMPGVRFKKQDALEICRFYGSRPGKIELRWNTAERTCIDALQRAQSPDSDIADLLTLEGRPACDGAGLRGGVRSTWKSDCAIAG